VRRSHGRHGRIDYCNFESDSDSDPDLEDEAISAHSIQRWTK